MPTYVFKNPNKEEYIEIVQTMNEDHSYSDASGVKWERVFYSPKINNSTNIDGSRESFMTATSKKCSLGDLWEASAIASEKREKSFGKDSLKEKVHVDYSKKTGGKKILSKVEI